MVVAWLAHAIWIWSSLLMCTLLYSFLSANHWAAGKWHHDSVDCLKAPKLIVFTWIPRIEWIMHLYSALLCIDVHPKRFTIMCGGGSLLNLHQSAASTWMMRRLSQDNGASALTTHQLQVERRNKCKTSVASATHQLLFFTSFVLSTTALSQWY